MPSIPRSPTESIPIGAACDGEKVVLVDEQLKQVKQGEQGEICILGEGVTLGYWRDQKKTDAVFVPFETDQGTRTLYRTGDLGMEDASGLLQFLGRKDSQIKSRGYRIELGEVEAALNTVSGVHECAIVAVESREFDGLAICAAYVPTEGDDGDSRSLNAKMGKLLPKYMIPVRWERYERLPKNANGKIDRVAIKERFATKEQ
jgi:acyl-coenzyme A synthetase/AMP-(fatty) acid ligase